MTVVSLHDTGPRSHSTYALISSRATRWHRREKCSQPNSGKINRYSEWHLDLDPWDGFFWDKKSIATGLLIESGGGNLLAGLVVRRPPLESGRPGFDPCSSPQGFFWFELYQRLTDWYLSGYPARSWRYRVSAGSVLPGVRML